MVYMKLFNETHTFRAHTIRVHALVLTFILVDTKQNQFTHPNVVCARKLRCFIEKFHVKHGQTGKYNNKMIILKDF